MGDPSIQLRCQFPFGERGAFWEVAQPYEVALPKSLLFPEGKREVSRRSRDGGIVQTTAQETFAVFHRLTD